VLRLKLILTVTRSAVLWQCVKIFNSVNFLKSFPQRVNAFINALILEL